MKYNYTVLGSRDIPPIDILVLVNIFARYMQKTHMLRTTCGTPIEASAFYSCEEKKCISFSPWKGYNAQINKDEIQVSEKDISLTKEVDKKNFKGYNNLSRTKQKILSCMIFSVMGTGLKDGSSFILYYKNNDKSKDDLTEKVIKSAKENGIDCFNLYESENVKRIIKMLKKKKIDMEKEVMNTIEIWKKNPPIGVLSSLKDNTKSHEEIFKNINSR